MLSISHPFLLSELQQVSYGLVPVFLPEKSCFILFIKTRKEAILTARLNNEIKLYMLSDNRNLSSYLGFVTAFFDDWDEPIIIKLLMFDGDKMFHDLSQVFGQKYFDLFFFDEHNRELMGVRAHNLEGVTDLRVRQFWRDERPPCLSV